jgi:predicted GNAT family acetyltransferase
MKIEANDVVVEHNEAQSRFEVKLGDALAVTEYQRRGQNILFTHVEVPPALEGHGIAARMARVALDYARAQSLVVVPLCPYIAAYLRRHREYRAIVHPTYQTGRS